MPENLRKNLDATWFGGSPIPPADPRKQLERDWLESKIHFTGQQQQVVRGGGEERDIRKELEATWKSLPTPTLPKLSGNLPPLKSEIGDSILGRVIDIVSRGEYASAATVQALLEGAGFGPELAKEFWEGFSGKKKITYDQIIDEFYPEWSWAKRAAASLFLSIALDPTMYVGESVGRGVTKGLEAVTRPALERVARTELGQTLGKMFRPGFGLPRNYYEYKYYTLKEAEALRADMMNRVKWTRSRLKREDIEWLSYLREHPEKVPDNLPRNVREVLDRLGGEFDFMLEDLRSRGLLTEEQYAKLSEREGRYLPHYYPERGINILGGQIPPSLFAKAKKPSFFKPRVFEKLEDAERVAGQFEDVAKSRTVEEALGKAKEYGLSDYFKPEVIGGDIDKLVDIATTAADYHRPLKDFLKIYAIRRLEHDNFIMREKFIEGLLNKFGKKVPYDTKIVPEGFDLYFPKNKIRFYSSLAFPAEEIDRAVAPLAKMVKKSVKREEFADAFKDRMIGRWGFTKEDAETLLETWQDIGGKDLNTLKGLIKDRLEQQFEIFLQEGDLIPWTKAKRLVGVSGRVPVYMLPTEIADDVNRATKFFIGDPATRKLWQLFDRAQNAWKLLATSMRLPFHLRNMYSNWWLMYEAGVAPHVLPKRLLQAAEFQATMLKYPEWGVQKSIKLGKEVYTYKELKEAIEGLGVHGRGWVGADVGPRLFDELESIIKYGKLRDYTPWNLGREFGVMVEDNARVGLFFDELAKGKSFEDASRTVRKYLFDYSELTDTERQIFRRIFPFYKWTRSNLPLQIYTLVRHPQKFAAYGKLLRAFDQDETSEEIWLRRPYFDELMYVKSPFRTEKGKPIYMSFDLPPLELNRVFHPRDIINMRHVLSSVSPWKLLATIAANLRTFPKLGKIEQKPLQLVRAPFPFSLVPLEAVDEKGNYFARAPAWVAWLPKTLLRIMKRKGMIDIMINPRTGRREVAMRAKWAYGFTNAFPVLNEISRLTQQPIYADDEAPKEKWKAFFTGISRAPLDTRLSLERKYWEDLEAQSNINFFMKQRGRLPTKDELRELGAPKEMLQIMGD